MDDFWGPDRNYYSNPEHGIVRPAEGSARQPGASGTDRGSGAEEPASTRGGPTLPGNRAEGGRPASVGTTTQSHCRPLRERRWRRQYSDAAEGTRNDAALVRCAVRARVVAPPLAHRTVRRFACHGEVVQGVATQGSQCCDTVIGVPCRIGDSEAELLPLAHRRVGASVDDAIQGRESRSSQEHVEFEATISIASGCVGDTHRRPPSRV